MLRDEEKLSIQWPAAISSALHETFVRSKYANSVSQFLIYLLKILFATEGVSAVLLSQCLCL